MVEKFRRRERHRVMRPVNVWCEYVNVDDLEFGVRCELVATVKKSGRSRFVNGWTVKKVVKTDEKTY
jgi:hypothetical protein